MIWGEALEQGKFFQLTFINILKRIICSRISYRTVKSDIGEPSLFIHGVDCKP